jgi:iron complex outermembrane receptor protein/hemoglobin/transferrin/lactoferrin receptor protein
VYEQQTAHGQASPFIRGHTGQQTLLLFDGIRLNNSTYRKGPNQYFFTVDAQTVHSIEVTRGGASTRYGSDAIGGVLDAKPLGPRTHLGQGGVFLHPRAAFRAATADSEYGYRVQLGGQLDGHPEQLLIAWRQGGGRPLRKGKAEG